MRFIINITCPDGPFTVEEVKQMVDEWLMIGLLNSKKPEWHTGLYIQFQKKINVKN